MDLIPFLPVHIFSSKTIGPILAKFGMHHLKGLRHDNLANNFWTVSVTALIFHMNNPCDDTFPWIPLFFTLWPWPWSWTHFLKTLTLLITFKQWVLELWYFTWIFSVIRPFYYILPCDIDVGVWPFFLKTLSLLIHFEQWVLELWYFTWVFLVIRPFLCCHNFL